MALAVLFGGNFLRGGCSCDEQIRDICSPSFEDHQVVAGLRHGDGVVDIEFVLTGDVADGGRVGNHLLYGPGAQV